MVLLSFCNSIIELQRQSEAQSLSVGNGQELNYRHEELISGEQYNIKLSKQKDRETEPYQYYHFLLLLFLLSPKSLNNTSFSSGLVYIYISDNMMLLLFFFRFFTPNVIHILECQLDQFMQRAIINKFTYGSSLECISGSTVGQFMVYIMLEICEVAH